MPIRFDSGGADNNNFGNKGNRGRGNNKAGTAFLMMLIFFVFRKPKIAIPLLVVAAVLYFIFGGGDSFMSAESNSEYGMGCGIDEGKYDQTMVYEPLASSSTKNRIPASASLLKYAPTRKNQGQQGSCVGWASAYAARTILEAASTGANPNEIAFSPSFLFNQIALPACQGSYTSEALEKMKRDGLMYFSKFSYDVESCTKKPDKILLSEAKTHRIRGYNRLSKAGNNYDVDIEALRQNIAQGAPVIIAMKIPESFYYVREDLWTPQKNDYRNIDRLGGHAMCAIAYDDNKFGGAVQVMNSWGKNWGNDGNFWIKYTDFSKFVREAYGLYPHPKTANQAEDDFDVSFGLVYADNNANIPVKQQKGSLFKTQKSVKKGDRFKVEVENNIECYVYIFGQETDGTSYVLFPYPEDGKRSSKYSAYCGVVGTRHFPSGAAALKVDNLGKQDLMAVVVSKDELDYFELNDKVNRMPGSDYQAKVNKALGTMQISNPNFKMKASSVAFQGKTSGQQKAVAVVLAIDKI